MARIFTRRRTIVAAVVVAAVAGIVFVAKAYNPTSLTSRPRRQWKDQAIAKVQQRIGDQQWLSAELEVYTKTTTRPGYAPDWVRDEIVVMANGEWIICQNICNKSDWRIKDLFIGRGSDGKWYYSTFHFCIGKMVLGIEPQPQSLEHFIRAFWLEEFDGRSDDCLRATWTGGPYGQERLVADGLVKPEAQ
jgi:hypothetical protein